MKKKTVRWLVGLWGQLWRWLLLALIVVAIGCGTTRAAGAAESSPKSVYIFKELEGRVYRQENIRLSIKSQDSLIISLRLGTSKGASRWVNFTTSAGSPSYQADLIEIPLGRSITDGAWHEVELLDLGGILARGGDTYDHIEKIGIRGTAFQLGKIEFFSGDANAPINVQVMSFDHPEISNMNQYGWYSNDSSIEVTLHYPPEGGYLEVKGKTSALSQQTTQKQQGGQKEATASSSSQLSASQSWYFPFSALSSYPFFSDWTAGPVYPPYIPPLRPFPPLFGLGYPPGTAPYGFGPQPVLSLLTLAGLPAYFSDPNPGYPYSAGGYNFATLFATGSSPYPFASPFPAQTYSYLAPPLAPFDPTYNIYTSTVTSTLAPTATLSGLLTSISTSGGGGGGGGGPGFAGGALI